MKKCKFILLLLPSLLFSQGLISQENGLNSNSIKVVEAYKLIQNSPNDSIVQLNYIKCFPNNWKIFLSVFQPKDLSQLYRSSNQYICILDSLRASFPRQIGELLINLGSKAHWEADATGAIQRILAKYASENTILFSELLNKKPKSNRKNIITFLADVESHSSYKEYQDIIDHLIKLKQGNLARKFEVARQLRIQQKH